MGDLPVEKITNDVEEIVADLWLRLAELGYVVTDEHRNMLSMQLKALLAMAWYEHQVTEG